MKTDKRDYPSAFIGKLAMRTEHNRGDGSYTAEPIKILKVTDSHIYFSFPEEGYMNSKKVHLLNKTWMGKVWVAYEPPTFIKKTHGDVKLSDCYYNRAEEATK